MLDSNGGHNINRVNQHNKNNLFYRAYEVCSSVAAFTH